MALYITDKGELTRRRKPLPPVVERRYLSAFEARAIYDAHIRWLSESAAPIHAGSFLAFWWEWECRHDRKGQKYYGKPVQPFFQWARQKKVRDYINEHGAE